MPIERIKPSQIAALFGLALLLYILFSFFWSFAELFYTAALRQTSIFALDGLYDFTLQSVEYANDKVSIVFDSDFVQVGAHKYRFRYEVANMPIAISAITFNMPITLSLITLFVLYNRTTEALFVAIESLAIIILSHQITMLLLFLKDLDQFVANKPQFDIYFRNYILINSSVIKGVSGFFIDFVLRFEPFLIAMYMMYKGEFLGFKEGVQKKT